MTKTLKKRFIIFTMTAITCLLVFIVVAINGLNWVMLEQMSDLEMEILVESGGVFQRMTFNRPPFFIQPMDMDRMRSARFFVVRSDADGNIRDVNTDQIFSIDIETAKDYALTVFETGKESGRIKVYKFAVKQIGPDRLTLFMDISRQNESFYLVCLSKCSALCWLIVLVFVISFLQSHSTNSAGMEKQNGHCNAGHEMKTLGNHSVQQRRWRSSW